MKTIGLIIIFLFAGLLAFFIMPMSGKKSSYYTLSPSINRSAIKSDLHDLKVEIHFKNEKVAEGTWTRDSLNYSVKIERNNKESDFYILFFKDKDIKYKGPALSNEIEDSKGMYADRLFE